MPSRTIAVAPIISRGSYNRTTAAIERDMVRLSSRLTTTSDIRISSWRIISYLVSPLAELHAEEDREK